MPKRYQGNIITPNPQTPANNYQNTAAPGVWGIYEVEQLVKAGLWPTLGNLDPGAFVENIFSTYLFNGSGSTSQDIVNGIDLSGEGGLVWHKSRSNDYDHALMDTENGVNKFLRSNQTDAIDTLTNQGLTSFNSDGYTIVRNSSTANPINGFDSSYTYASWTFRKAPKFFDVVTYTGDGTSGRTISHNLGSVPGCIFIKRTSSSEDWVVYHVGSDATAPEDYYFKLNTTAARIDSTAAFNDTAPTSTNFTVGNNGDVNANSETFVAYLFAHNDGDGEFGPDGDADIIKCGSYSHTNGTDTNIDLGFEPQWVLIKSSTLATGWFILDNMRGITTGGSSSNPDPYLLANSSGAESSGTTNWLDLTSTGFTAPGGTWGSGNYIYIAIRRGPMAVPTDATEVFDIATADGSTLPQYTTSTAGPIDTILSGATTSFLGTLSSRLTGTGFLKTYSTDAELTNSTRVFDYMNGFGSSATVNSSLYGWMWKRAPNFFDVVAYTGTGSARTVTHNLGVAPEMIWVKSRSNTENWQVGHKDLTGTWNRIVYLNRDSAEGASNAVWWNNTAPTSEVFSVGTQDSNNGSGLTYIAYLFASLDGVSKVGSYTGNGEIAPINIDCGFSSGARFVLIKRTDSSGDWYVYDSERGIVAGGDPYLLLNSTAAEVTGTDYIDPYSSGFTISDASTGTTLSVSGATYIFYAIA